MGKYTGLVKSTNDIEYLETFQPFYVMQQKFTRKAIVKGIVTTRYNVYYLIVNDIKICKVTIDKKAYTKSRYYINYNIKLDCCDFRYITDFLQQKLTLQNSSVIKKLVNGGTLTKDKILKYAKVL